MQVVMTMCRMYIMKFNAKTQITICDFNRCVSSGVYSLLVEIKLRKNCAEHFLMLWIEIRL